MKTFVASKKSDEGTADKLKRDVIKLSLIGLVGKKVSTLTKAEQDALLVIIGQIVGLLDDKGKVKPL